MLPKNRSKRIDDRADPFKSQGQDGKLVPIGELCRYDIAFANPVHEQRQRTVVGVLLQCRIRHPAARVHQRGSRWVLRNSLRNAVIEEPVAPPTKMTVAVSYLSS